ncbi:EscU/YscU/HrcU family type III secretion system export apparatus switch protein [Falsiroseomonas oryzae]|uniref:EscU/YscU/HrcU family type III secretion system export apparatus switch protein n=1 Tax=Falsiroseomonas oryzae TaxID=2766473 RepID=UPI0022EA67FF|nr:EscU/YscU/HrcU family type III secretion system export apparatus switch protein [Roseomonas sp. MO-31]
MAEQEDAPDPADRSEAATPRRIERAREQGQVALSREAAGFGALLLASLAALLALPPLGLDLLKAMRALLERGHEIAMVEGAVALGWLALLLVLPVAAAAATGAIAATLLQTRGLVSATPLRPRLDKINPWAGLKRLFGMEGLAEFVRSLLKLALVGAALWYAMGDPAELQGVLHAPAGTMLQAAFAAALRLIGAALAAFAAIALLDLLWVRFQHLRMLRMTRQELREELKENEGDPMLRARRRQIRESRARVRMMAEVPRAAVVITNPTHYAVALAYAGGDAAPRVVAKGVDEVAARIRAAAEAAGVPMVSNPPLARALHRLELGAEIPAEHYQLVAEIIAFVWRRAGRGAARGA